MQLLTFTIVYLTLKIVVFGQFQTDNDETINSNDKSDDFNENFEDILQHRQGKFLPLKTRSIFSLLRQSPATNYEPINNNDLFDFLRDSYPLPKGKKVIFKIFFQFHKRLINIRK